MKDYVYHRCKNGLFRLHIECDDEPWNPRTDTDGNIGTMFCMHRRYNLGDKTEYHDTDGLKREMIDELDISMKRIRNYARSGDANVDLKYNRSSREWEVWGSYSWIFDTEEYGLIESSPNIDWLDDTLIDGITVKDLVVIAKGAIIVLPLFLFDHSGLRISTADFNDPWDSGRLGVIWTTISRVKKAGIEYKSNKELTQTAIEYLQGEVKLYDQYLKGECYGYIEEKLTADGAWEETDSCWGYYTDSLDPLKEIASSVYGDDYFAELPLAV